jgi:hypothetical protein
MGADRQEEAAREAAQAMDRDAARMEHELGRLGEHIEDAEKAAENRPEAGSDALADATGDWEQEASGAQQGEDAVDAAEPDEDKRDADDGTPGGDAA